MKIVLLFLIIVTGSAACPLAWGTGGPMDSPYVTDPKLADLMTDVIFYVSYNDETMKPDIKTEEKGLLSTMPASRKEKRQPDKVYGEYAPGIIGKALKMKSGCGIYAAEDNIVIKTSGSISFWFKPVDWKAETATTLSLLRTEDISGSRVRPA